ncbi:hypothetical protein AFEL58S_02000 [Afipia felis]
MRYRVTTEGWLDGNYRKLGEIIELSDAEAKWLVRSGQIVLADELGSSQPVPKRKKAAD